MTDPLPFFCLPDVKPFLNADIAYDGLDDLINSLQEPVSAAVRTYCRRDFDYNTYTEYFESINAPPYPTPVYKMFIKEGPIDSTSLLDQPNNPALPNPTSTVGLNAPATPSLYQIAGGSFADTTYYVAQTFVIGGVEGPPSPEQTYDVSANYLLQVLPQASAPSGATATKIYVSTNSGSETLQATVGLGMTWTMLSTGLVTNTALPPSASLVSAYGQQPAFKLWYDPNCQWDVNPSLLFGAVVGKTLPNYLYWYDVDLRAGRITTRFMQRYSPQGFRIMYNGGYPSGLGSDNVTTVTLVPTEVVRASAIQCAFYVNRIRGGNIGEIKASGDRNMRVWGPGLDTELVPEAAIWVRKYRRPLVGKL